MHTTYARAARTAAAPRRGGQQEAAAVHVGMVGPLVGSSGPIRAQGCQRARRLALRGLQAASLSPVFITSTAHDAARTRRSAALPTKTAVGSASR